VLDREQRILMVNTLIANFLNQPAESLVGIYAWNFPQPALQAAVTRALSGTEVISQRMWCAGGDGAAGVGGAARRRWAEATGVVIVLRDVTHELEVDRMKTVFVSMASHELRTPLTGVVGFAKLIQKLLNRFPPETLAPGNIPWEQAVQRIQDNLTVIITESHG
jgi:signal transduction histidine kinase